MSAVARIPLSMAEKNKGAIDDLTAAIKAADNIEDLKEARARVEAMKAWAKVHGCVKQLRLDLLRIEVEALVRIVQLGGVDTLPAADRKAAEWLAKMDPLERTRLVNESGSATTASGMCRSIWREDEIREHYRRSVVIGQKLAAEPTPPAEFNQEAIELARDLSNSVSGALAGIADRYIQNGVEFTISELADEIITDAALPEHLAEDAAINKGVQQVVREAVRRSPPLTINGTTIPRVITARNGKRFVRIPVMNATIAHLDDMILMRREQLEQDRIALQRLEDFAKLLKDYPGADDPEARIGALVASSITETSERVAS